MNILKNFKILLITSMMTLVFMSNVKSAEECFEKTSRAIFKFNGFR